MKRFIYWAMLAILCASPALAQTGPNSDSTAEPGEELAVEKDAVDIFARDKFSIETIVCPFKGKVKYKPGEISCGLLTVPENREKSRSRSIKLHFVTLHARKPEKWDDKEKGEWRKREDPIIYLTGGPGAQAVGYVKRLKDHGARDVRDLYILEQRGIGFSDDFCPKYALFDPSASNKPDWESYQRAQIAAMENCFAGAKAARVDLSAYNTIENARDVEALRRSLGIEKWNVWGISYGSILGQAYLKQDPAGVRAVVLDAVVPIVPGAHFQRIGSHYQRDLDLLEKACSANKACAGAFPELQARFKAAIGKVKETPIEVDAIDAELFPSGKGWFFQDVIAGIPFSALYEQKNYAALPAFMSALSRMVEEADYETFRLLTSDGPGEEGVAVSRGMYNSISCNDGWYSQLRDAVVQDATDHPELASFLPPPQQIDETAALCKRYGMNPRPEGEFAPVVTDIPAVIASGEMDPITPPPLARAILPGFANATYVEFPFAGHGPTRSVECAGDFLTKFYDAPENEVDASCADEMKAPKFEGPLFETHGLTRLAIIAAKDEKMLAGPAIWFGAAAIALAISLVIYMLAPLARIINHDVAAPTLGARPLAFATALVGAGAVGGLAYAAFATFKAGEFLLLAGLVGWARWFSILGVAAGLLGLGVLYLAAKARARQALPVGTFAGLILTGTAGVALAAFLMVNGFGPV